MKKYTVTFENEKAAAEFAQEALSIESIIDNNVTVTVQNDIREFLAALNRHPVVNLSAPGQSLEEIFLQYYGGNKMFNWTLFKRGLKESWKMLLIFAGILTMYSAIIISMFDPELSSALEEFAKAMPELMTMFGMVLSETTLLGFMSAYLYGFLMLIVPMVFSILYANESIARHVDRGSMTYMLAAPVKRTTVAFTQMKVLATEIFALVVYTTTLCIVVSSISFPGELEIGKFILLNIGLLCLQLFIAGICFLCSCIFNESKRSLKFGAGISALAFVLQLIANNGGIAEKAKYATFFTLFNPEKLVSYDPWAIGGIITLFIGAITLFVTAITVFSRKDLHI